MMLKNSTINSKYSYKGITGKFQKFKKSDGIVSYFRVASSLCLKAKQRAKPFNTYENDFSFSCKKLIFTGKVLQEPYFESERFWNSENNGLL